MKETERRKMVRQKSKGRMTLDEFRNQAQQLDDKYTQMEEEIDQVEIEVGPILYGMDRETALNLKQKRSSKQVTPPLLSSYSLLHLNCSFRSVPSLLPSLLPSFFSSCFPQDRG
jgi:hypothetical protein